MLWIRKYIGMITKMENVVIVKYVYIRVSKNNYFISNYFYSIGLRALINFFAPDRSSIWFLHFLSGSLLVSK